MLLKYRANKNDSIGIQDGTSDLVYDQMCTGRSWRSDWQQNQH